MDYHIPPDSVAAVLFIHAYMVETSASSVMSAENTADNLSVFHCHHTGRGIPLQESLHTLSGVIDTPDSKPPDLLPESIYFIIIVYRHNSDHS